MSETHGSHMQLEKHLASYFLEPQFLGKGKKSALAKWFPFSSYRTRESAFLECSAYILRFAKLFSSRHPNLSNQDACSERSASMPQWITASLPLPSDSDHLTLTLLSSKNINLDKFLTLISCYVYCLSPHEHLPNVNSMRRVALHMLLLINS